MIVSFISKKDPTSKYHAAHSLLISHNKRNILIDCRYKILEGVTDVVLTQARQAAGLQNKRLDFPVYLSKYANKALSKEQFPFRRKIFWKNPFDIEGVTITPVPVEHSVNFPATGLLLESNDHKIGYFPNVLRVFDRSTLDGLDLYIGDGRVLEKDVVKSKYGKKYGHASIRSQLKWLNKHEVKRAIFTNLGTWAKHQTIVRKVFNALSQEFGMKVAEGMDGYRVIFEDGIHLQRYLPSVYLERLRAIPVAHVQGFDIVLIPNTEHYMLNNPSGKESTSLPDIFCHPSNVLRNVLEKYKFRFKNNISERLAMRDELVGEGGADEK